MDEVGTVRFGVIADVQYADVDDGYNYSKTSKRFYRQSLNILKQALSTWKNEGVKHVFQLGDVIDGKAKQGQKSKETLGRVVDILKQYGDTVYHIWGNHEFYNFTRSELNDSAICSAKQGNCVSSGTNNAYYYTDLSDSLRVIVMDTYELSLIGMNKSTVEYQQQYSALRERNKNADMNSSDGLHDTSRRFVMYNGGCSASQTAWLDLVCSESEKRKQNVIVMSHCPVFEDSCDKSCLCWNYDDVMKVLANHKESVLCYFAGHDHVGGYAVDSTGIHHITMPGVIESSDMDCYATVVVHSQVLEIIGSGQVPSLTIPLKYKS